MWPAWLWFMAGTAAGVLGVTGILFWIDLYQMRGCPTCGATLVCDTCGHYPHHEFQGEPRGLQGVRRAR